MSEDETLVGCVGEVVSPIRGPRGPGEIDVVGRGGHDPLIAYAGTELAVGERVLIINHREAASVDVVAWVLDSAQQDLE